MTELRLDAFFKRAAPRDLKTVLGLMRRYYAYDHLRFEAAVARAAARRLISRPDFGQLWLIQVSGETVGYMALCFGYSLEIGGRDAFVDELFVLDSHRGSGLGTKALKHAEKECAKLGIRALRLEVTRTNPRALSLYRRLGFKDHDRYLMTRLLS